MKAILNDYDGSRKLTKRQAPVTFSLDFADSNNPQDMDSGIIETLRGVGLSMLAVGRAIYRMDQEEYYRDLGYGSMYEYLMHVVDETGISRSYVMQCQKIGRLAIEYKTSLEKVDFSDTDGPSKLPYLERALEIHPKREVFKNLKTMPVREFAEYAKESADEEPEYKPVKIKKGKVYAGDEPIIPVVEGVSPENQRYYAKLLLAGAEAKQKNQYLYTTLLYDEDEARRVGPVIERTIKELRIKYKGKK